MSSSGRTILLFAWVLSLASLVPGCASVGSVRAYPLYSSPERSRAPESLAQLEGMIATIDGLNVEARGTAFALLPGCHVVTLRRKVGQGNVSGAWMADLGKITYAFRMKPSFFYSIDIQTRFRGASHGEMTITAEGRDSNGSRVEPVVRVRGPQDIHACLKWEAEQSAAGALGPEVAPAYDVNGSPGDDQYVDPGELIN